MSNRYVEGLIVGSFALNLIVGCAGQSSISSQSNGGNVSGTSNAGGAYGGGGALAGGSGGLVVTASGGVALVSSGGTSSLATGGTTVVATGGAALSGSGGTSASGGSTSVAGAATGGSSATASCIAPAINVTDAGVLLRAGATDPGASVQLDDVGYYTMPSSPYHGYCFTSADNYAPGGSTVFPPCGPKGPCFTAESGLCLKADLGVSSNNVWGAGIGCNLNQMQATGAVSSSANITGKTTLTVAVYGCKPPAQVLLQLNVVNPPFDSSSGILGSGYFCVLTTLSAPDATGFRTLSVPLADLRQDCWKAGGPLLDPATMKVSSVSFQAMASSAASNVDFCVAKLLID